MAVFTFYISTGYSGAEREEDIEIPDEELENMTEREQDDYIDEYYYQDWLANNADMGFRKKEEK